METSIRTIAEEPIRSMDSDKLQRAPDYHFIMMPSSREGSPWIPGSIIHDPEATGHNHSQGIKAHEAGNKGKHITGVWRSGISILSTLGRGGRAGMHAGQQRGPQIRLMSKNRRPSRATPQNNPTLIPYFIKLHNQDPIRLHCLGRHREGP